MNFCFIDICLSPIDCPQAILEDCDKLIAKGIMGTGKGFDLHGKHLGELSRQPTLSSLQHIAVAAAENRALRGTLLPSVTNHLGGDINTKAALSPIQAAARKETAQWFMVCVQVFRE